MGSRIGTRGRLLDDVIWLDPIEVVAGHLTRLALPRGARLSALGVMLLNALKLKLTLQIAGFDARFHAYDWRRSVERLADELPRAHRGGRRAQTRCWSGTAWAASWRASRSAADRGRIARAVQLGAPNSRLVRAGARAARRVPDRAQARRTRPAARRGGPRAHRVPHAAVAARAAAGRGPRGGAEPVRLVRVAGRCAATRSGTARGGGQCATPLAGERPALPARRRACARKPVAAPSAAAGSSASTITHDGDGTVPLALAVMPESKTWFVAETHGGLPNNGRVISAVVDLLRDGHDRAAARRLVAPRTRTVRTVAESTLRRVAPHKVRWQDLSPDARRRLLEPVVSPEFHGAVSTRRTARAGAAGRRPVGRQASDRDTPRARAASSMPARVRSCSGVFRNVDPSGAAAAVDERLGGAVREFTLRRMFSGRLGEVSMLPGARAAACSPSSWCSPASATSTTSASEAQSFVAENVVQDAGACAASQDFATVLFGTGSGIPVATALEQQLQGILRRTADRGPRSRRPAHHDLRDRPAQVRRAASGRRGAVRHALPATTSRVVVDEAAPSADEAAAAPGTEVATRRTGAATDPAYLLVTLSEQGRGAFECRSSLLTAGAKAAVLSGLVRVDRSELDATLGARQSGRAVRPRDGAVRLRHRTAAAAARRCARGWRR